MTEYFETLRGQTPPQDCDENGMMTTAALTARMGDATGHALHTLGLGPRKVRENSNRVRLLDERIGRQVDLRPGDVFHVESKLVSSGGETHVFDHRLYHSDSGALSCTTRTQVAGPPLPQSVPEAATQHTGVVTYRGRVSAAECDQMRHMNVQFYMEKNSQALAQLGAMLGLSGSKGTGFYPAADRILFEQEVYAGDVLVMRSAIRKIDGDQLHIASMLQNSETGSIAARFETVARLWDTDTGETVPLPEIARNKAKSFATAKDDAFPLPRPITGPRLQADIPKNAVVTCRRAVNTWEVNDTAVATPAFVISCVSDAAMHFFTHVGASHAWRVEHDIGSAALDYNITYLRPMAIGTPVEAHSQFLETREKTFRFSHHLSDATTDQITATIEVTAVLFDLTKRKSILLPDEFHEKAKTFGAQKEEISQ